MRYWHPRAQQVVAALSAYQPDRLIMLPLYPQFSTTTSESSLKELHQEAIKQKGWLAKNWQSLKVETLCCYPTNDGFIDAQVALIRPQLEAASAYAKPRLLLSAHGLPKKMIAGGDPYQAQCEATARAIVQKLNWPDLEWLNCYQSRVGPLEWIGPSTDAEIERAGKDEDIHLRRNHVAGIRSWFSVSCWHGWECTTGWCNVSSPLRHYF